MDIFVGVVLIDSQEKIYLIKEEDKNKIGKNRWNLPGGSVDGDESLIQSAKRELREESGYDTQMNSLLGVYYCKKEDCKWIYVVFSSLLGNDKKACTSDKSVKEGKWFTKDDFLHLDENELVHPDMQLVYNIAIENKGLALECVKSIDYSVQ